VTKAEVRRRVRDRLASLTRRERKEKSWRVCRTVLGLPEVASAEVVMLFLSLPDEVDTTPLIEELRRLGKLLAVPHTDVASGELAPVLLRPGASLHLGALDVPEPDVHEPVAAEAIDIVVVPGRAFDRTGRRVGRGKGFYDRFLAGSVPQSRRLAVAYGCQVFDEVPAGRDDVPVEVLVTEDEVLRFPRPTAAR